MYVAVEWLVMRVVVEVGRLGTLSIAHWREILKEGEEAKYRGFGDGWEDRCM